MKRRKVTLSVRAERDLEGIFDWVAERSSEAVAQGYVARIETQCRGLEYAAERGSVRSDGVLKLRALGFEKSATIVFAVLADEVLIMRVFRRGVDWRPTL